MAYSIFGNVVGVRKFTNGDTEIDFFHDEEKITELLYSSDSKKLGNLTKELADYLSDTLASGICAEVFFDDSDKVTHIEFEECEYDDDLEE